MQEKRIRLLAGLGNPGKKYENTRHNIGFMVIDALADKYSIGIEKNKFEAVFGRGRIDGHDVFLVKPMAFMNRSGHPLRHLTSYFNILCEEMLIIHDDIDLTYERIKIKSKGGHAGHNGLRSIVDVFRCSDFGRIRVGIGRPENHSNVIGHVLGTFSDAEIAKCNHVIAKARDAAVTIINGGMQEGMNKFN